jgi:hypothetical protein
MISLGLENVAKTAPEVSFVHDFPGTVNTAIFSRMEGVRGTLMRTYVCILGRWILVPVDECGDRQLYLATSARFPPLKGGSSAVRLGENVGVSLGTKGEIGGGIYSVSWDGESASSTVLELLAGLRGKGMVDEIWRHTEGEFKRVTELNGA